MQEYHVYVNVDGDGNVTEGLVGSRVVPEKPYDYHFILDHPVDLTKDYKVINGLLFSKEEK